MIILTALKFLWLLELLLLLKILFKPRGVIKLFYLTAFVKATVRVVG